ncbi:MAG: FAD-dependent oxidoreductase [Caulobacterales bacterium]|uniref:FAD-dependent oxidoreductase n=1 Tax=Glycocaulis sp. TaxID=1969725 RepID=UPI003FA08D69
MDRRSALKLITGAGLGMVAAPLIGAGAAPARTPSLDQAPNFVPADISPRRIIRQVVGLRPFRETGYVVRAERFSRRKTLVHHYGHGGAGVTMSWGTAAEAERALLAATDATSVAVLGCGVIGLTTALLLRRRGMNVTIYAEALPPHTTSNIAGAVWGPSSLYRRQSVDEAFLARFVDAARVSQRAFQHLANDPRYGVYWLRQYDFSLRTPGGPREPQPLDHLYPGLIRHTDPQTWFGYPSVTENHVLMIDPDIYLRALMADFENAGGRIVMRRFETASDIGRLDERVIVNCTGLGARDLFGDPELRPMRGQLTMLLPQPELDYAYTAWEGGILYMFPRRSSVVLGGTTDLDMADTLPSAEETARQLDGHARIARRLAGLERVEDGHGTLRQ